MTFNALDKTPTRQSPPPQKKKKILTSKRGAARWMTKKKVLTSVLLPFQYTLQFGGLINKKRVLGGVAAPLAPRFLQPTVACHSLSSCLHCSITHQKLSLVCSYLCTTLSYSLIILVILQSSHTICTFIL